MNAPTLSELPSPPPGKNGWPWTEQTVPLAPLMSTGQPWPRISIVTPSLNQGQFLEETLRSVLLQGYPDLEYIVMDGGSTDSSVDIIKKYADWLSHWESVRDRGQSHAINKGFARASGNIWAWINSDDIYLPGALSAFASLHARRPDAVLLCGACEMIYGNGEIRLQIGQAEGFLDYLDPMRRARKAAVQQPAFMWRSERALEVGPLDEENHISMDLDFALRLLELEHTVACMPKPVARFRVHEGQKSGGYLISAPALLETQVRHFKRVQHLLPAEEQRQIQRNLRTTQAHIDLARFARSGWVDGAAFVRSFVCDPRVMGSRIWEKLRALGWPAQ